MAVRRFAPATKQELHVKTVLKKSMAKLSRTHELRGNAVILQCIRSQTLPK